MSKYVSEIRFGDKSCEANKRLWLYMLWASGVADNTPFFEDGDWSNDFNIDFNTYDPTRCGTHNFAMDVFAKADCVCTSCTGPGGSQPYNGDQSCNINVIDFVIDGVAVSARAAIEAAGPSIGDSYLVVSGISDIVWSVGLIYTWNGTGWDSQVPNVGSIIEAQTIPSPTYWLIPAAGQPGNLFPPLDVIWDPITGTYIFTSEYPLVNTYMNRDVIIEVMSGNNGWVTIFVGQETALANPLTLNLGGLNPTQTRVVYYKDNCQWESIDSATPPFGFCGVLNATYTTDSDCENDEFTVTANISSAVNYPISGIRPRVNGVNQALVAASLGNNVFGPYPSNSNVDLTIVNAFDEECNVTSPEFTDPRFPQPDYTVDRAVDASFEPSADPALTYLIVSNTQNLSGGWADHVGEIWSVTGYTVPAPFEIIFASQTNEIATGYWQMDGTTPRRMYQRATILFNEITQVYTVSLPQVAPDTIFTPIQIDYTCVGSTTPEFIFIGQPDTFTTTTFTPVCNDFTSRITYTEECPITLLNARAIVRPVGEPDPNFFSGLNDAVLDTVIDSSDRIIVGGLFTAYGSTPVGRFTRLNSDGSLDTVFNTALGTGFNAPVRVVIIDSAGRYLVGGDFTSFNGTPVGRIARITTAGALDTAFNTAIGTGFDFQVRSMVDLGNDTYVIGGQFGSFDGSPHFNIIKIDINGAVVTAFNGAFSSTPGPMSLDPSDGNIICNNGFSNAYQGGVPLSAPIDIIGIGPNFGTLFKIDSTTGAFINTITKGSRFNEYAQALPLPNGNIVVTGRFTQYDGQPANRIAMIDQDGDLLQPFRTNIGSGFNEETTNATLLPNGQIAITMVELASVFNGNLTNGLILLDQNGNFDNTFNRTSPGITGGRSTTIEIQSTGSLVVTGWFTGYNGLTRLRLARLI